MPTLIRKAGYIFTMVMYDCAEPKHVHVKGNGRSGAKIWLEPIEVDSPGRYNDNEIKEIVRMAWESRGILVQRWNEECARMSQKGAR